MADECDADDKIIKESEKNDEGIFSS